MEQRLSKVQPLVEAWVVGKDICHYRRPGPPYYCSGFHFHPGQPSSSGSKKTEARPSDLGRSRGGLTSKIHLTVNGAGQFCRIRISSGAQSDYKQASALVAGYKPVAVLADRGYDADWFIEELKASGVAKVVIPPRAKRKQQRPYDKALYKGRNVVERAIHKLKFFRKIATRYEKTARNFYSLICLAAALLNSK